MTDRWRTNTTPTPDVQYPPQQSAAPGQFRPPGYPLQYHAYVAPGPYAPGPYAPQHQGTAPGSLPGFAPFPGVIQPPFYAMPGYPAQYAYFNRPSPVPSPTHHQLQIPVNVNRQSTGSNGEDGNRAALLSARGEVGQGPRPPASKNHGAGGRPSAVHIQLNKRIVGARTFVDILAIVEAEHGEFNAVNTATACSRLAKAPRSGAKNTMIDDLRVQALFATVTRVAPTMDAQAVANALWALATLGWQAADGAMRCALEAAAVRVAPSMKPQEVANIIWGDRKSTRLNSSH